MVGRRKVNQQMFVFIFYEASVSHLQKQSYANTDFKDRELLPLTQ